MAQSKWRIRQRLYVTRSIVSKFTSICDLHTHFFSYIFWFSIRKLMLLFVYQSISTETSIRSRCTKQIITHLVLFKRKAGNEEIFVGIIIGDIISGDIYISAGCLVTWLMTTHSFPRIWNDCWFLLFRSAQVILLTK